MSLSPEKLKLLAEIDTALTARNLTAALRLAHACYESGIPFTKPQLLLLSVAFAANIDRTPGRDVAEKQLSYHLWDLGTKGMSDDEREEAVHTGLRLAEIYLHRGDQMLTWSAVHKVRPYVTFGPGSLHYNFVVEAYVRQFDTPDTDLWFD